VAWGANIDFPIGTAISYSGNNYITTGNVYSDTFNYGNVSYIPSLCVLDQIRRGTQGTATSVNTYPVGTAVVDGSTQQTLPGISEGNIMLSQDTNYMVTEQVSYTLALSANVTANVGSYITQATTGANAKILTKTDTLGNTYIVSYQSILRFNLLGNTINTTSNIAINGQYTGNVYPIGSKISGYAIDANGNVKIVANTVLRTGNIWLPPGANTATTGGGLKETIGLDGTAGQFMYYNKVGTYDANIGTQFGGANITGPSNNGYMGNSTLSYNGEIYTLPGSVTPLPSGPFSFP
jgi:hypothetical protein